MIYLFMVFPNPKSMDNDFKIHYLNKNDSLTYNLRGRLMGPTTKQAHQYASKTNSKDN